MADFYMGKTGWGGPTFVEEGSGVERDKRYDFLYPDRYKEPEPPKPAKKRSEPRRSSSKSSSPPPVVSKPPSRPKAKKPTLNLPSLNMSQGASVVNQFNKLRSQDSMLKQQAIVDAHERSVASGAIHGSQAAGAAERAIEDRILPLAQAEANLIGSTDIANWQQQTNQYVLTYKAEFEDYLRDKGYAHDKAIAMAQMQSNLATAYLDNVGALLRAPEIEFGSEVKNKLVSIYNRGLENNNTILGLGFSYT